MLEMKMMNLLIGALIVPLIGIAVLTFSSNVYCRETWDFNPER